MKKLCGKKAFTLIEIILAIAIFAAIALPLLSVFVQSIKTDRVARNILSANYISQDYIESLDALTYSQALTDKPSHAAAGEYYLSASITPYGTADSLFGGACSYAHLVMYSGGSMLAVMPDGKWQMFGSVSSSISLSVSSGSYTFTAGYTTITGTSGKSSCALLINGMDKPTGTTTSISAGSNCKALLYCQKNHESDFTVTGDKVIYEGMISGGTSLVHVTATVYDNKSSAVASSEAYVNIKNW